MKKWKPLFESRKLYDDDIEEVIYVSKTETTITPEDVETGHGGDSDFVYEDREMTLSELEDEIMDQGYIHRSKSGYPDEDTWITTEGDIDYGSGEETSYSLFFSKENKDLPNFEFLKDCWVELLRTHVK